jgi:amino acid transporter
VSIAAIMVFYLAMNIGVVGRIPWKEVAGSSSVASLVVTRSWGHTAADIVTILIIVTAFASIFAGLLGGSRVPFNAARDGVFFSVFGKLHPRYNFPHVALIVMGVITAIGSFFYASAETLPLVLSAVWIVAGLVAYLGWAKSTRSWPFARPEVHEAYLELQRAGERQPA